MPTGGNGGNEAAQARADEDRRQQKIRAGTTRVNSIFDGSFAPGGEQIALDKAQAGQTYFTGSGEKFTLGQGENALDVLAKQALAKFGADPEDAASLAVARQNVQATGQGLFTAGQSNGGFTDDFFKGRRQAYIDYATPQLEDQYGEAQKELTFALSRSGNLNSSVRGQKVGDLQKLYDTNKQKVADDALSFETQARNSVEDARSGLISTLNVTGDSEGAANAALARSTALSQTPAYCPLTQLFTDFTSGLGTQMAAERSAAAGGSASRYSTGLFGPKKGAVRNSP